MSITTDSTSVIKDSIVNEEHKYNKELGQKLKTYLNRSNSHSFYNKLNNISNKAQKTYNKYINEMDVEVYNLHNQAMADTVNNKRPIDDIDYVSVDFDTMRSSNEK